MKKEKAMRRLEITILVVILAALVGWFSYLVYRNTQSKYAAANVKTTDNTAAITNWSDHFLDGLVILSISSFTI